MYSVRRAEEKDIPSILRLLLQVDMVHHRGRPDLFKGPATKYTAAELKSILATEDTPVFVCVNEKDEVLGHGFCILQRYGGTLMTEHKALYIDDICIDEKARRTGAGKTLYDYILQFARISGCYHVTLNVWCCNPGAMAFYEKLGLQPYRIGMEKVIRNIQKILITAFEPFGGSAKNASVEVLERLPDAINGIQTEKLILPVVFGTAAQKVLEHPADCIFLLGEAGGRTMVTPELRARNLRNAKIPDNAGRQPENEIILPGGPDEYRTQVPADIIVRQMKTEGYPIDTSEDAGTFVCNDTFFLTGASTQVPVEFIHVPARYNQSPEYAVIVSKYIEEAVRILT